MSRDNVVFFSALASEMNRHPELFERHGEADFATVLVMASEDGPSCVRLVFEGVRCTGVDEIDVSDVGLADFRLVGSVDAWDAMFDDIAANGRATGHQTINSLALLGESVTLGGDDPMGLDKFSRFNQTLQEFFDGYSRLVAVTA